MTKEEIGRVIKESRTAAGLTQLQVAEALGRPQNTVSAWEMGRAQPDANTLFDLFRVLGRSVDEAFGFSSVSPLSGEAMKVAWDYDCMDQHGKHITRGIISEELKRMESRAIHLHYYSTKVPADVDIRNIDNTKLLVVKCNNLTSEADFCVSLADDLPRWNYSAGSMILIKRQSDVKTGELGLFKREDETVIGTHGGRIVKYANATDPKPGQIDLKMIQSAKECIGLILGKLEQDWILEEWS